MTRGHQNLYGKLVGNVARTLGKKKSEVHDLFKIAFNAGNTTTTLDVQAYTIYFDSCLEAALRVWGRIEMSPFDEDLKPFDHGFVEAKD